MVWGALETYNRSMPSCFLFGGELQDLCYSHPCIFPHDRLAMSARAAEMPAIMIHNVSLTVGRAFGWFSFLGCNCKSFETVLWWHKPFGVSLLIERCGTAELK